MAWARRLRGSTVATYHVDATAGDDSADGLSESTPWRTLWRGLSNSSYARYADGDTILLKRGEVWREQFRLDWTRIADGAHVTLDAYGSGAKPVISGGLNVLAVTWSDQGGNIWRTPTTSYIGEIVVDDASVLRYRASLAACVGQGDFYSDGIHLYMCSAGDPAAYYAGHTVEATQSMATSYRGPVICNLSGRSSHFTLRNLAFKYWGYNGLAVYDAPGTMIEYCDWKFCGGANPTGSERDGNALMIYNASSNSTVRYCDFSEVYYMATSMQCTSAVTMSGMKIYGNTMHECYSAFECWPYHSDSAVSDNYFCHNTCYNAGYGLIGADKELWLKEIQPTENEHRARYISLYVTGGSYGTTTGCVAKNNIFLTTNRWHIYCKEAETLGGWDIDYNCYYPDGAAVFRSTETPGVVDDDFADWKTATGQDAHSVCADPLLTLTAGDQYLHISSEESPCVEAAVVVSGIPHAIDGALPDIGVYEYPHQNVFKLCLFKKAV